MQITYSTDAPSNGSIEKNRPIKWHTIDWRNIYRNVRRLQTRIMKAVKEGKGHKVRSLQRLLVRATSSKSLAVRRVTENQGKRTAGVDRETWNKPEKKEEGIKTLGMKSYKAKPLRRVYIPKKNGKKRPLGIPTMLDRAEQALHALALEPIAETTGDSHSYGFRKGRSIHDAIAQCFNVLSRRTSPQWILEADIKACFDNIDHQWLLTHIPIDQRRLREWLKAGFIEKDTLFPTEEGTPQGGIISPILANMTLDGLQTLIAQVHPKGSKVHLIRYADDFIITAPDKSILERDILPLVRSFLQERGLTLSDEKTVITHIHDGFDFLGKTIRKFNDKLLIKPSKQSVHALLDKVRQFIKTEGRQLPAVGLIRSLNPIIKGWVHAHRHVVSKQTFAYVDFQIRHSLWRWAKRRHRDKSSSWIYHRYFKPHPAQRSQFHASDGNQIYTLFLASSIPIRRFIKIRHLAHPFDPAWESYFEQRLFTMTLDEIVRKPKFMTLWHRQLATCPLCSQPLSLHDGVGWHVHHLVHKVNGGSDDLDNLLLLHPNCHQQLHHPDFNGHLPRLFGVRDA